MGNRGKAWYKWAQQAGMEVVGVVDINREILDAACDELEVPAPMRFESIGAAAKATGATVGTICSANPAHFKCLDESLDAGLNVIIEKPMVERHEDAVALIQKAEQKGLRIAVSQNYRYHSGVLTTRDAVEKGDIGEVVTVNVTFIRWRPTEGLFLPLMLNQSIHHFDGLRWVLGADPEWMFAKSWNPGWNDCDGPTVLEAIYGFSNGAVVTYSGSYVAQGKVTPYSGNWRIEGSKGRIQFEGDGNDTPVTLYRREPEEERELPLLKADLDGPSMMCREFLEAVKENRIPPTDATDNILSLAMAWGTELSSRENRVVQISEVT